MRQENFPTPSSAPEISRDLKAYIKTMPWVLQEKYKDAIEKEDADTLKELTHLIDVAFNQLNDAGNAEAQHHALLRDELNQWIKKIEEKQVEEVGV